MSVPARQGGEADAGDLYRLSAVALAGAIIGMKILLVNDFPCTMICRIATILPKNKHHHRRERGVLLRRSSIKEAL